MLQFEITLTTQLTRQKVFEKTNTFNQQLKFVKMNIVKITAINAYLQLNHAPVTVTPP